MAALLTPGSLVASRWIVGGLLGQSERAQVYEAEEARQSRFSALKILAPALAEGEAWNEYVSITKKLAELPGDGIARAYDIGKDTIIERPYIASERLVFPTLSRYVTDRGAIPLRSLALALETLCGALDSAHAADIVHGGLKPQNVFISLDNPRWARITDFAIGRLRADAGGGPGSLLGWSSPEAAEGVQSPASDRYSLALLCFFAATGTPWYSALRRAESGEPAKSSRLASERAKSFGGELDPAFDAWFERALAVDPAERFPSATEMAEHFRRHFSGSLGPPPPSSVHPFAATRPIPLEEQPTVPVQQVDERQLTKLSEPSPYRSPSTRPVATITAPSIDSQDTGTARSRPYERTVPLVASEQPRTETRASLPALPVSELPLALKLLAAIAAASVAFAIWWWIR